MSLGIMPGRYPATVVSYSASSRTCRIEIPGLTDGGDVMPEAEIEYPIGDKSRSGNKTTEIEINSGDSVWVSFIAGDPRYPIITGYRNPGAGNSDGWRRFHHENIELLAKTLIKLIAGGELLIQSDTHVLVKAPSATVDADDTEVTGSLTVNGVITGKGGIAVSGGSGARFSGDMRIEGSAHATGDLTNDGANSPNHEH